MMGSGNGRRGMKSPPILIAVLLACIFVLTINYWITSSRCAELQKQLAELESRIHRVAAERGAVELKKNEFQDKLERQKKQIDNIQSLHNSQLQSANDACHSEKETLLDTIAEKEKVTQDLYAQIKSREESLSKLKLDFEQLQESQAKKSTFELAQCGYKMKELNEQCEEKLRRASGKGGTVAQEENADTSNPEKPKSTLLKDQENQENQKVASPSPVNKETNDTHGAIPNLKQKEEPTKDSITDSKLTNKLEGEAKEAKEAATQENKVMEETNNEEVEREQLLDIEGPPEDAAGEKQVPNPVKQGEEQGGLNDYNGDEGNEAEPEADKQAELADDQNVNEDKLAEENKPKQDDNLPLPDAPDLPNAPNLLKLPNAPNPVVPEESENEDNPLLKK